MSSRHFRVKPKQSCWRWNDRACCEFRGILDRLMSRLVTRGKAETFMLLQHPTKPNRHSVFSRRGIYDGCTDLTRSTSACFWHPHVPDLHQPTINFSSDPRIVIPSTAKAYCGWRYWKVVHRNIHAAYFIETGDGSWKKGHIKKRCYKKIIFNPRRLKWYWAMIKVHKVFRILERTV